MRVKLHFRDERGYMLPAETVDIDIIGPPRKVDEIIEAIREKTKQWEYWEEK